MSRGYDPELGTDPETGLDAEEYTTERGAKSTDSDTGYGAAAPVESEGEREEIARVINWLYDGWMDADPDDRLDPEPFALTVADHVLARLEALRARLRSQESEPSVEREDDVDLAHAVALEVEALRSEPSGAVGYVVVDGLSVLPRGEMWVDREHAEEWAAKHPRLRRLIVARVTPLTEDEGR